jgi:hypothetical protein
MMESLAVVLLAVSYWQSAVPLLAISTATIGNQSHAGARTFCIDHCAHFDVSDVREDTVIKNTSRSLIAATLGLAILGTVTVAHASRVVCGVMWQDANLGGPQFAIENNVVWNNIGWFNDKASSIKVYDGCSCQFFLNANGGGTSFPLTADQAVNLNGGFNDSVSSVVCHGPP